ncbi:MAG TPA: inositol monophosphatase family protein [Egibacteraceae bacterium]
MSGAGGLDRELLELAVGVARAAGAELLARYGRAGAVETKTSATDPVSEADRASERLLVDALLRARPDDGLMGEEGAARRGSSGLRWVLDPLDGTVNYLYGFPAWAVSVACEDDDGARVGVVHDALRGETFTAVRGAGAHLLVGDAPPQPLRVNDPVALEQALVATGFSYDRGDRRRQAAVVAKVLPTVRDIRRGGSAALDLCSVAAGRVDGYYEDTTSRWDWAAGALVAREAGAVVTPLSSPSARRGVDDRAGLVAAGPALHPALAALVSDGAATADDGARSADDGARS